MIYFLRIANPFQRYTHTRIVSVIRACCFTNNETWLPLILILRGKLGYSIWEWCCAIINLTRLSYKAIPVDSREIKATRLSLYLSSRHSFQRNRRGQCACCDFILLVIQWKWFFLNVFLVFSQRNFTIISYWSIPTYFLIY